MALVVQAPAAFDNGDLEKFHTGFQRLRSSRRGQLAGVFYLSLLKN